MPRDRRPAPSRGSRGQRREPSTTPDSSGLWHLITTIGSPVALGTVLLFYFGWVRTSVQMHDLGFDSSVMNLSTTDYILKSINVLSIPLVLLLITALLLSGLHQGLVAPAVRRSHRGIAATRAARILAASWMLWAVVAIAQLTLAPSPWPDFAIPLAITLALLCALYGRALHTQVTRTDPWSPTAKALVLVLLAFAVFWDTERIAGAFGHGYAAAIAANPQQLVAVTVYSAKNLELNAPGVVDTGPGHSDSAYRHRYTGLRLLQRTDDRYFLINERWDTRSGRIVILRESDGIRLEFSR